MELQELVNDPEFKSKVNSVDGAEDSLRKFRRMGHRLVYITNRPERSRNKTFRWLREHDIPFDEVHFAGRKMEKGFLGRRLKLDMYVDDLERNLESMWKFKKRWPKGLLLMDRPWNRQGIDGSRFQRVKNWKEILDHATKHRIN
jgi:uncharacterized HAD superfamily protein